MSNETNNIWQFNSDGSALTFAGASDLLEQYQNLYSKIFPNISLEPSTPQGQIISARVEESMAIISELEKVVNYFFLGGNNEALDIWAWNTFRATRKKATNGYVGITIEGVPNTTIPSGFTITDGTLNYAIQSDITIPSTGSIDTNFICTEVTETISLQNTITHIVTPIIGVDRVNNPSSSIAGIFEETDSAFYNRCITNGSLAKNSSYRSIKANVAQVSGVIKIAGYENYTKASVTYKGTEIGANSFALVILGGSDNDIATTIAECKPPGSGMTGDVEVEVDIDGSIINYYFYRPKPAKLQFSVNCQLDVNSPTSYASFVKEAIQNYVNNLEIGAYITQPAVANAIQSYVNGFKINSVQIGRVGSALGYTPIELQFLELAQVDDANISVTGDSD